MKVNRLVDDLDGSIDGVQTRQFAIDGRYYSIDLSQENWQTLRRTMEPYIDAARTINSVKYRTNRSPVRHRSTEENSAIRNWGRANGWPDLGERGRVPGAVIKAYKEHMRAKESAEQ